MEFTQFMELPVETKLQIINKCRPISYVRFRGTCRFLDEFCEHNRKWIRVYCPFKYRAVELLHDRKTKLNYVSLRAEWNQVKFETTPDNMIRLNKALSGFVIASIELSTHRVLKKQYYAILNYFIEAVPDFKVNFIVFTWMRLKQVEQVMSSKWKIGGVKVDCLMENRKILKIERIRKMDPLYCQWKREEKYFTEEDIVQLARGKKRLLLFPNFLSTLSSLNVVKTIAQNWKKDGYLPISFRMTWDNDRNYRDADISGLYSEIMDQEACHLGCFLRRNEHVYERNDIWIRKDGTKWHLVRLERHDYPNNYGYKCEVGADFIFETTESTADFIQKMAKILLIYNVRNINGSSLYQACLTDNMEKIKEAFLNFIPKQHQ